MAFFTNFAKSAKELKSIKCIVVTAVLIALDIVLKSVSIKITDDLKITFAYLALASIGMLFGPTVGFLAGTVTDLIGFMMNPDGGFNPLFTLVEATGAMIYGIFLYNLKVVKFGNGMTKTSIWQIVKIVLSKVTVVVICNLIMTPAAMILSGYNTLESTIVKYPARLIKNGIQCPVDCVLLILVLFPILIAYRRVFGSKKELSSEKETA